MKLKIAIGFVGALAAVGLILTYLRLPAYRGVAEPLSSADKLLDARLQKHVRKLAGDIGARSLTSNYGNLQRAASYIEEKLQQTGLASTRQTFSVNGDYEDGVHCTGRATQSTFNIIAEIPGTSKASEIVVIGAHYDSVFDCPAANDNASGVAAMLEIARSLSKDKFPRTVRFVAFTNEEPPFFGTNDMGSYRYAQACKERGDKIVAMLSLETIGYYTDQPDSQSFPLPALAALYPTTGNFVAFIGKLDSRKQLIQCANEFNAAVKFPSEVLSAPEELSGIDFSDQRSFWRLGYPGIMVSDTALYRYPHYHKVEDTPDKLDYDSLAIVTSGLTQVVRNLASSADFDT